MNILNTKTLSICNSVMLFSCLCQPSWTPSLFLIFQTIHDAIFELVWSDEPEEDSKDNKRSELFVSHTCIMLIFCNTFHHLSAILNF